MIFLRLRRAPPTQTQISKNRGRGASIGTCPPSNCLPTIPPPLSHPPAPSPSPCRPLRPHRAPVPPLRVEVAHVEAVGAGRADPAAHPPASSPSVPVEPALQRKCLPSSNHSIYWQITEVNKPDTPARPNKKAPTMLPTSTRPGDPYQPSYEEGRQGPCNKLPYPPPVGNRRRPAPHPAVPPHHQPRRPRPVPPSNASS